MNQITRVALTRAGVTRIFHGADAPPKQLCFDIMQKRMSKILKTISTLMLSIPILLSLSACSRVEVQQPTYPSGYVYIDRSEVRSSMIRLSTDIWIINDILDSAEVIEGYRRERIITALKDMEEVTNDLGAGAAYTNHLVIDENIDEFKDKIRSARKAVEQEPPSYYLVGRLSGGCLACHVLR